mmetsp:Transcript_43494/g.138489  ORF Transcript_43494/g.138489 Transcript_43494/m.138489 type:complete len:362 (+) Transcript_43494:86-1171(+)
MVKVELMRELFWMAVYAAAAVAVPSAALLVLLLVISIIRSCMFVRKRGWQSETVPHTLPVELYQSSSAVDSQHIRCCLAEKGVSFKEHELDIGFYGRFDHLEKEVLRVNPNGSTPTLVHEGHPVLETEAIIAYIDAHFSGAALLPSEPQERGEVIRWLQIASTVPGAASSEDAERQRYTLGMAVRVLSMPATIPLDRHIAMLPTVRAVLRHPNPMSEFPKLVMCISRLCCRRSALPPLPLAKPALVGASRAAAELDEHLADGREFLVGSSFTLADVCVIGDLNRLELLGILDLLLDGRSKLRDYWCRMKARDSFELAFRPKPEHPGHRELQENYERFRKEVEDRGLEGAYQLEDTEEEEEE